MDLNYRILWFEDNDEWFESISSKVEKYIEGKNLKVSINRVRRGDEKVSDYGAYEIMVVDYQLEGDTYGNTAIQAIRDEKYYNDVIFYSSAGNQNISKVLSEEGLQGVFTSDRNRKELLPLIHSLVDKSLRRSESIVNIRGVVMDSTSSYDSMVSELILKLCDQFTASDGESLKNIIDYINTTLLMNYNEKSNKFLQNYSEFDGDKLNELLEEREFNSYMKIRLLNKALCMDYSNKAKIEEAYFEVFDEDGSKMNFMRHYEEDVLQHRNDLAHASPKFTEKGEMFIGKKGGKDIIFNAELCDNIRANLIKYEQLFKKFDQALQ
ncbi:hypothetical protein HB818_09075 [Listeria booriae]|uniref:hypothetical protein n=1 Tax=Listeria booriae TaxID=1552123 RepID=UPI00162976C6|nr:hypothetical protein [Listeria booriae]MBC1285909.1 hypothetical protein [Listeria booriae]